MFPTHLESLEKARQRIEQDKDFGSVWLCKTGVWPDAIAPKAAVLKLFKEHWLPGFQEEAIASPVGIFFSVWIDDEAVKKRGLHYNVHALKLRQLPGHALESRKFASAFRAAFGPRSSGWPSVKMAYGPQTLFQGFAKCPMERAGVGAYNLAKKFISLGGIIDGLLKDAAKRPAELFVMH
ncbi:MAG: hypothetical protein ACO1TE_12620 [Prosthecobacter sp.]